MLVENIFHHLFESEEYFNVVYPHLNEELFSDRIIQVVFKNMHEYSETYNKRPNKKDVALTLSTDKRITQEETDQAIALLKSFSEETVSNNIDLVIDQTEKWVKARTMEMAIMESIEIIENDQPPELIEDKVINALSVSFKNDLGAEYLSHADTQYDWYITEEEGMPTDTETINEITGGGFRKKALYVIVGRIHIGKTLWLCHLASNFLQKGKSVVYISAEMSQEEITKRIDSNVLDLQTKELDKALDKEKYFSRVKKALKQTEGKLFVKEYPSGMANRNHIMSYLKELKIKKDFVPDVVLVDYINELSSSRLPASAMTNSYLYMKAVTQELRAIALEEELCMITATQFNRDGASKSADKTEMDGTGESWAIPAVADFMGALIQPKELYEEGKYLVKVLKNRFDQNLHQVYTIGVDRNYTRLYQLDDEEKDIPIQTKRMLAHEDTVREQLENLDEDGDSKVFVFDDYRKDKDDE